LKGYLPASIAFLSLAGLLLSIGLPYVIAYPWSIRDFNAGCISINEQGQSINTCDRIYFYLTIFGIISSVIGMAMMIGHRATKKEQVENPW
jgi:hypothetical protein